MSRLRKMMLGDKEAARQSGSEPAPTVSANGSANGKPRTPEIPAKSQPNKKQSERSLRKQDPLLVKLDVEPSDQLIAPQRGFIPDAKAALLRAQLRAADMIRKNLLAPDLSLDWPLDRTPEREGAAGKAIDQLIESGRIKIPPDLTPSDIRTAIMNEIFGFGPIQPFIDSDSISEIMVNGPYIVFIERKGRIVESGHKFLDDDHVERIVKRIVSPLGRLADEEHALVDARLPDGSRVNAVLRPVALDGPSLTIRKFSREKLTLKDLENFGSLTPDMALFLEALVVSRQNVIVSGGTGSGKTTLINCLSALIPEHERAVTIEDAAELQMKQRNVVRMETKKPTPESPAEITIRDCVRNALRMRPERIIVGECRGGEALDMLQAMNTGHDGSMTTIHANDPRACLSRLETLVLMAGADLPLDVVRKQVAGSINFIVQAARFKDGSRKVTHITELQGMEGDIVIMSEIFKYVEENESANGKVGGRHMSMGVRPKCEPMFKLYGYELPAQMFLSPRR